MQPVDAYGIAKNAALTLVMHFCRLHALNWYWLRVFSVFGENEKSTWLIPSIIQKIGQGDKQLAFTTATQQYAYLYIQDFVKA
ncbi:NAD-dependent epimerase/dehydratase family protein, partial [Streptomyces brasiliscabiei]